MFRHLPAQRLFSYAAPRWSKSKRQIVNTKK
jgi:hypothetical protein